MTKRKLIPVLFILILVFIASQFNAFGSLTKLTDRLIVSIKNTIAKVSRILVAEEKNTAEIVEKKTDKQPTVSITPEQTTTAPTIEKITDAIKERELENDDWKDEILDLFSYDLNDDLYQEPEYDNEEVEESDDWDALVESLTIEIFSLSGEDYSEYFDLNDREEIKSLSNDELSALEQWLNIDKEKLEEMENSIDEFNELMDEFNHIPNSD